MVEQWFPKQTPPLPLKKISGCRSVVMCSTVYNLSKSKKPICKTEGRHSFVCPDWAGPEVLRL